MKRTIFAAVLCAATCFGSGLTTMTEYRIPSTASFPEAILGGTDGAVWFTETATDKIGRVTPAGVFNEYQLPGTSPTGKAKDAPWDICIGPDGAMWITENTSNKIARLTFQGVFTNEWVIPTHAAPYVNANPRRITLGPDGNLWFTEYNGNRIGRITTAGVITEFLLPTMNGKSVTPSGITAGPDGAIWFNENAGNQIVRMTTEGVITNTYPVPSPNSVLGQILTGPDGNLWVTENYSNKIGRLTTAGVLTEWTMPTPASIPTGLTVGSDGTLWFTEWGHAANNIGRITTSGVITEYPIPTLSSYPWEIAVGPDNNLWFTEYGTNKIGTLPDCAIGLSAAYHLGTQTLAMNFNVAILTPAIGSTVLQQGSNPPTTLFPPAWVGPAFPPTLGTSQVNLAPMGIFSVTATLANANSVPICSETVTVNSK